MWWLAWSACADGAPISPDPTTPYQQAEPPTEPECAQHLLSEWSSGDTYGQTDDWAPSCGGAGVADVAYRFYAEPGVYVFETNTSTFDALIAVYEGCDGEELTCDGDASGVREARVRVELGYDEELIVVVDGFDGEGVYAIEVTRAAPAETECDDDLDEDLDLLVDCEDPDCATDPSCP